MGAPANHADGAPTSTATLSFPEPDPVALALCVSAGPPRIGHLFRPDAGGARRLTRREPANESSNT